MDLPRTEAERVTHERHRRLVVVAALAVVVLGLVGVTAWASIGHDTPRVVASPTATQHSVNPTAHKSELRARLLRFSFR